MRMLPSFMLAALVTASGCDSIKERFSGPKTAFSGQAALNYVKPQIAFGPRVPGTPAHEKEGDWIIAEMKKRTDSLIVQSWTQTTPAGQKLPMRNIIARFNPKASQRVLYLTHWDTRPVANEDVNFGKRAGSFDGANDGASGVGLFLALADVFKKTPPSVGVDLAFVDGEDWGSFDPDSSGNVYPDALFGSQYLAEHLPDPNYKPLFGVLFDMIGDSNLQLYQEANSVQNAPEVVQRVWQAASDLGYSGDFLSQPGLSITDDHLPLQKKGLHVIDVVDIQYGPLPAVHDASTPSDPNYHHTTQDTFDKLSARSLQVVGDVALTLVK